MLGGRIVEITDRGYCDVIGVDPVCVAHLSEEEKFRALGGIANVGVEERGWKAVARSMKEHPSEWAKAFAVSPLPPNHPLSNVVQGCASSYVGSSFLRVLHWEGKVLLAPFAKFTQLPFLRTLVIGETPPVEHIQWQSETGLFRIVGWAPLRHGLTSGAAVSDCIGSPSPRLSALLVKVSEVCKVATPRLWSVDDLGRCDRVAGAFGRADSGAACSSHSAQQLLCPAPDTPAVVGGDRQADDSASRDCSGGQVQGTVRGRRLCTTWGPHLGEREQNEYSALPADLLCSGVPV
jgi:hypothetical protein